jgi:hypothetical protein
MVLTAEESLQARAYEEVLQPTAFDERIGQVTELPADGGELAARLERTLRQKTRNLVRKSLRQGFSERIDDDEGAWRFLHDTHVVNMQALGGRPKPWSHFVALRECIPPGMRRLSVAYNGETPVAALLLLQFNGIVEYFVPVTVVDYRAAQPLSFLIWRAMLALIPRGFRWWNWGGTWVAQRSLHHFKAGWGAQDRPYTYLVNCAPSRRAEISARRDEMAAAFPYYYIFPFAALDA